MPARVARAVAGALADAVSETHVLPVPDAHADPVEAYAAAITVAVTHQALDSLDGPAVLVGHSYGGVVITEAGNHPNVAALAYIAAFAPDTGESVSSLIADPPTGAPVPPILPGGGA